MNESAVQKILINSSYSILKKHGYKVDPHYVSIKVMKTKIILTYHDINRVRPPRPTKALLEKLRERLESKRVMADFIKIKSVDGNLETYADDRNDLEIHYKRKA